ncbi:MAG: hypothetical protein AAGC46_19275 [Solirubrobacteraceae bacterium]|nr:hypothetical protein [Patulibacter sp.]
MSRPQPRTSRPEADDHVTGCGEPAPGQTTGRSCAGVGWAPSCKLCPASPTYEGGAYSARTDYATPGYVPPVPPEPFGGGPKCANCGYAHGILLPATEKCKAQKTGKYRSPPPPDRPPRRLQLADPTAARVCFPAAVEWQSILSGRAQDVVRLTPVPQVTARPPRSEGEFASHRGQAAGLGRTAAAKGWAVEALYWRAADGAEGCAVRLARGSARAVATWKRKPGHLGEPRGWESDIAYVWMEGSGTFPTKLTTTALGEMIVNG